MTHRLISIVAFALLFAAVVFPSFGDALFITFFVAIGLILAVGMFMKWRDREEK